jgi:hypothetical protein
MEGFVFDPEIASLIHRRWRGLVSKVNNLVGECCALPPFMSVWGGRSAVGRSDNPLVAVLMDADRWMLDGRSSRCLAASSYSGIPGFVNNLHSC